MFLNFYVRFAKIFKDCKLSKEGQMEPLIVAGQIIFAYGKVLFFIGLVLLPSIMLLLKIGRFKKYGFTEWRPWKW